MSTLRLKLAAAALIGVLGASAAHAQTRPSLFAGQGRSTAEISQQGRGNGAAVSQNGPANRAGVTQRGANNTGQVVQEGANNSGAVYQLGSNNSGSITQTGDNNAACLVQLGNNNAGAITQSGNGNRLGVAQNSVRAWEFAPELCDQHGGNAWSLKRQVRAAGLEPIRP
jgi:Curlin associated repeat